VCYIISKIKPALIWGNPFLIVIDEGYIFSYFTMNPPKKSFAEKNLGN
jgi:hypothetical protein